MLIYAEVMPDICTSRRHDGDVWKPGSADTSISHDDYTSCRRRRPYCRTSGVALSCYVRSTVVLSLTRRTKTFNQRHGNNLWLKRFMLQNN